MNQLVFANQGVISLIDILTIGGSEKRNDPTKIGQYSSGLSYAVSILIRNGVDFYIESGDFQYTFQAEEMTDGNTGKTKEIVGVNMKNLTTGTEEHYQTAFSTEFGYDWTLAMGIREILSNCRDEEGMTFFHEGLPEGFDTLFVVEICDKVQDIVNNWDLYFLDQNEEPVFTSSDIKVFYNVLPDTPYTIYKNGIQVYTDPKVKSLFVYDHRSADLDEMRIIRELSSTEWGLSHAIKSCKDAEVIKYIFDNLSEYEFLYENDLINSGDFSTEWHTEINSMFQLLESSFPKPNNTSFWNCILKDSKFKLSSKKVNTSENWWDSSSVLVSIPTEEERLEVLVNKEPISFEQHILNQVKENYNFEVEFPIIESIISKSSMKVVANKSEGILYVSTNFDVHKDMPNFIKEYYRLSGRDIFSDFCEMLQK